MTAAPPKYIRPSGVVPAAFTAVHDAVGVSKSAKSLKREF